MNSEIYETAAWRNFGMLDGDEAAGFDEAMRSDPELQLANSEVECLTAAMAAVMVAPVKPRAGQLEQLHLRLSLNTPKNVNWLAISGWATAAAVTLFFLFNQSTTSVNFTRQPRPTVVVVADTPPPVATVSKVNLESEDLPSDPSMVAKKEAARANQADQIAQIEQVTVPEIKLETQRLTQEVEVLQRQLETAKERESAYFEPVPGLSRPVIMQLKPPESSLVASAVPFDEELPLSTVIGDALARRIPAQFMRTGSPLPKTKSQNLSAIVIYDPARDTGTLVVTGEVPSDPEEDPAQLWVISEDGLPVYVGTLPQSDNQGSANTIDFNLGKKASAPRTFIITSGSHGAPLSPSPANTLLEGPR